MKRNIIIILYNITYCYCIIYDIILTFGHTSCACDKRHTDIPRYVKLDRGIIVRRIVRGDGFRGKRVSFSAAAVVIRISRAYGRTRSVTVRKISIALQYCAVMTMMNDRTPPTCGWSVREDFAEKALDGDRQSAAAYTTGKPRYDTGCGNNRAVV